MFTSDLHRGARIMVTGGGTGLGFAMANRLAELGADLVLVARRLEKLQEAKEKLLEHGGAVEVHSCDLREPDRVEATLEKVWENGPLSALVNNAAGNFAAPSEALSMKAVEAVFKTVAHGTAAVTLGCGRRWLEQGREAQVLSIVTTYASTGSGWVLPSAMGKAAVLAMTRSLAVEWGSRGIRFNAIAPGPFPTEGATERLAPDPALIETMRRQNPLQRFGDPEELANLACFMLSPQMSFLNGEVITIDGGEWLQGAGQFNFLRALTAEDWAKAAAARKK